MAIPFVRTPQAGVAAMFLLDGALFGIWASRIPVFVERFGLSADWLGLLLLCLAVGAIMSFPLAGILSDRFGAAVVTRRVAVVCTLALWSLAFAPTAWTLGICLALFGATLGTMDVGMNAWGTEVEKQLDRPVMSSFHAMFSLGAGVGAASGYLAARLGFGVEAHFLLAGALLTPAALAVAAVPWSSRLSEGSGAFAFPQGALVPVGLVAFCAALGEGAMADWGAVFLYTVSGASEAQAALGYVAFSTAMVIMRVLGDQVVQQLGPVPSARLSGAIAGAGTLIAILGQDMAWALVGFAMMGVGYAVVVPLAFSRAANDMNLSPGRAVASVATFCYGGMLMGPPLIGFIAEGASFRGAFVLLVILAGLISMLAGCLRTPARKLLSSEVATR